MLLVVAHDERAARCRRAPVAVEHGLEPCPLDRLRQVVGGAERKSQATLLDDGDHDDGNVGELRIGLQRREHRPAVDVGHHHVEQDRAGLEQPCHSQSRLAISRRLGPKALLAQEAREQVAGAGVVVDHQDGVEHLLVGPHLRGRREIAAQLRLVLTWSRASNVGQEADRECGALAGLTLDSDVPPEHAAEGAGDGKAEAGAAEFAGGRCIRLREALEQAIQLLRRHADAGVTHAENNLAAARRGLRCARPEA